MNDTVRNTFINIMSLGGHNRCQTSPRITRSLMPTRQSRIKRATKGTYRSTMTGEPETALKSSSYLLMVYALLFGALSSLLAVAYITLSNQGIKFFEQPSLFVLNINIWPLVLLTVAGCTYRPRDQVLWTACGIGSFPASIRPDWPPQPPLPAQHPASGIYSAVEWCSPLALRARLFF